MISLPKCTFRKKGNAEAQGDTKLVAVAVSVVELEEENLWTDTTFGKAIKLPV